MPFTPWYGTRLQWIGPQTGRPFISNFLAINTLLLLPNLRYAFPHLWTFLNIICLIQKSSYEWHIPKGILKTSWLQKHLFEVPSVCVLFFELNWDDLLWNQKRTECVAKVEYLRRSLNGRNTRITLVLIQSSTPLPSDDSLVTERAALLCSSCDLNAKSLFVLQVSDVSQLMGYILR